MSTSNLDRLFDEVLIGHGVSVFMRMVHVLTQRPEASLVWITDDEWFTPQRAMARRGWLWSLPAMTGQRYLEAMPLEPWESRLSEGADLPAPLDLQPLSWQYFDPRSSQRRFRPLQDVKVEWGEHEAPFFSPRAQTEGVEVDGLALYQRWLAVAEGLFKGRLTMIETSFMKHMKRSEDGHFELEVYTGKQGTRAGAGVTRLKARRLTLGDYAEKPQEYMETGALLTKVETLSKGKQELPGFSLSFTHGRPWAAPQGILVLPLVSQPAKKGGGSHLVGRQWVGADGVVTSSWFGFLNEAELEDNNEILKKSRHARRVLEKIFEEFSASDPVEQLGCEMQMTSVLDPKKIRQKLESSVALFEQGLHWTTDVFGPEFVLEQALAEKKAEEPLGVDLGTAASTESVLEGVV